MSTLVLQVVLTLLVEIPTRKGKKASRMKHLEGACTPYTYPKNPNALTACYCTHSKLLLNQELMNPKLPII